MPAHRRFRGLPFHHRSRGAPPSPPAPSVANYLNVVGNKIQDSTSTDFQMRGTQWIGMNKAGLGFGFTLPYTDAHVNPTTGLGDANQLVTTYKLNTVRVGISWHHVERNAPTVISAGVYKHDWTDGAGVINPLFDTVDNYLGALDSIIADCKTHGVRVILGLQQSQWSPGCDPVQGVGLPAWMYATPTGPNPVHTLSADVTFTEDAAKPGKVDTAKAYDLLTTTTLNLANWPPAETGTVKVVDNVSGTVFLLDFTNLTASPGKIHGKPDSSSAFGTMHAGSTITLAPDEAGVAKWEFFQPSGGYARTGVIAPPQTLMLDFWKFIITRYKDNDTVVGIDFLNEPGWPSAHPAPFSTSYTATGAHTPTDVDLVTFYNNLFTMARAIQPKLLLIYENGTYANVKAGRAPLTALSTPPSGSQCVMSWHYYPVDVSSAYPTSEYALYTGQRDLARTTFGHPFWVGEHPLMYHLENKAVNQTYDITDTWLDPSNATYPSSMKLWERLWRQHRDDMKANNVSWSIWAYQTGAGRSILNSDGTPKTDFLAAIEAIPDPPLVSLGVAVPITQSYVGSNLIALADSHWVSPNWKGRWYDSGPFGRAAAAKTTPANVYAGKDFTITTDGTAAGTLVTNTTDGTHPSSGFNITGGTSGAPVTVTFNAQVNSMTVTNSVDPSLCILAGKLWAVNKNGTLVDTLADFNLAANPVDPGGYVNFTNCTVSLQNFYQRCPSALDPAIRLQNCRALDALTPYFDGFLCEGITRDWCKPGNATKDLWFRHGTVAAHPHALEVTDPTLDGINDIFVDTSKVQAHDGTKAATLKLPPLWKPGVTYALHEVVTVETDNIPIVVYSTTAGNVGNAPPASGPIPTVEGSPTNNSNGILGCSNTYWQFMGDMHSDGVQAFIAYNTQARACLENVFFYQTNHAGLYCQTGSKNGAPGTDKGNWSASTNYSVPDLVRDSAGQEWYALVASGPGSGGAKNPLAGANPTYWKQASAHNMYAQYCIFVGKAEAIANGCEDPTNGARDCVFAKSFDPAGDGTVGAVQGTGGGHKYNGINTGPSGTLVWVWDDPPTNSIPQIRGILNINNVWADDNTKLPGSA